MDILDLPVVLLDDGLLQRCAVDQELAARHATQVPTLSMQQRQQGGLAAA